MLVHARTFQNVYTRISESSCRRSREGGRVEPPGDAPLIWRQIPVGKPIGPARRCIRGGRIGAAEGRPEKLTGLHGRDPVQLPSTEKLVYRGMRVGEVSLAFAERQLPNRVDYGPLPHGIRIPF